MTLSVSHAGEDEGAPARAGDDDDDFGLAQCWHRFPLLCLNLKFAWERKIFPINTTTNEDDSCVQFHLCMGMFVPDSIGVPGVEDDVVAVAEVEDDVVTEAGVEDDVGAVAVAADAICEMDVIVADTYESEDDVVFEEMAVAADAICEMDVIVADTYESEDDVVFEEMTAVSEEEIATRVTILEAGEVSCSLASEKDGNLGFHHGSPKKYQIPDLNLPSIEDLMHTSEVKVDMDFDLNKLPIRGMFGRKDDPFYEESFMHMLRLLLPNFY